MMRHLHRLHTLYVPSGSVCSVPPIGCSIRLLVENSDEPPGSVHSEITGTTFNLSIMSLLWTFSKPNVASKIQLVSFRTLQSTQSYTAELMCHIPTCPFLIPNIHKWNKHPTSLDPKCMQYQPNHGTSQHVGCV